LDNYNPDTLFVGKEHAFLDETASTNHWLSEKVKSENLTEGFMACAGFQTKGKGRLQRIWNSEKGKNVLCSYIFRPSFLSVKEQPLFNIAIALAVRNALSQILTSRVWVKWPNDILVEDRKIAGILIENNIRGNTLESSITGIGINVNQRDFDTEHTATSIYNQTGRNTPLSHVLNLLSEHLEKQYLRLKAGRFEELIFEYNRHLYAKGQNVVFSYGNEIRKGVLQSVLANGTLEIVTSGEPIRYHFNEIKLKYLGINY
jgi:BirA family biotin operon repressor/biotin-[acetyl-CoA-carboxylase] ligase